MIGQYTLWDMSPNIKKRRPCEYSFRRYIGQKVKDHLGEHTISEIGTFYTYFTDGLCGTPHDLTPVDPAERMAAINVDLDIKKKQNVYRLPNDIFNRKYDRHISEEEVRKELVGEKLKEIIEDDKKELRQGVEE